MLECCWWWSVQMGPLCSLCYVIQKASGSFHLKCFTNSLYSPLQSFMTFIKLERPTKIIYGSTFLCFLWTYLPLFFFVQIFMSPWPLFYLTGSPWIYEMNPQKTGLRRLFQTHRETVYLLGYFTRFIRFHQLQIPLSFTHSLSLPPNYCSFSTTLTLLWTVIATCWI